ncbi:hypothetical protein BKA56DRAFT_686661 [Ilyonectria sp. MPI-CAGE-AT-0026]|nr:hypothetical protein BKA56DRAFT_686661 [Ilyonectria sp. MPI-CAGE-AT-0026]
MVLPSLAQRPSHARPELHLHGARTEYDAEAPFLLCPSTLVTIFDPRATPDAHTKPQTIDNRTLTRQVSVGTISSCLVLPRPALPATSSRRRLGPGVVWPPSLSRNWTCAGTVWTVEARETSHKRWDWHRRSSQLHPSSHYPDNPTLGSAPRAPGLTAQWPVYDAPYSIVRVLVLRTGLLSNPRSAIRKPQAAIPDRGLPPSPNNGVKDDRTQTKG